MRSPFFITTASSLCLASAGHERPTKTTRIRATDRGATKAPEGFPITDLHHAANQFLLRVLKRSREAPQCNLIGFLENRAREVLTALWLGRCPYRQPLYSRSSM